jgi:hypothetical protein
MSLRGVALIAVAVMLSAGLFGVQLASGGADFVPQRPADPCQDRERTGTDDLEALAETVVLTGLDEAACNLGVSRERLLLAVPSKEDRAELAREAGTDQRGIARALKNGLRVGIDRLEKRGQLPKASKLLPSVADLLGLPANVVDIIPDSVVDELPPTADVLRWSLDKIDFNAVLADLDGHKSLESALLDAFLQGAIDEAKAPIKDALPDPLQDLFG